MTKKVYRVRNWSEYNKGLVSRGSLSVWFNKNHMKSAEGGHGNQAYSDLLILCAANTLALQPESQSNNLKSNSPLRNQSFFAQRKDEILTQYLTPAYLI